MDFDLSDVGEFINDNPQIPLAAGLVAGQAINRNVQRARQDAAAIKKGLDAIQRQNDEARRLALDKEQREKALADNRDFLFQLSTCLDRLSAQGYSLGGYLEIEQLARNLINRNLSTAAFADYGDKEFYAEVERKASEARSCFAEHISPEDREQIREVIRRDQLCLKSLSLADALSELRKNEEAQKVARKKLAGLKHQNTPSLGAKIKGFIAGDGLVLPSVVESSAKIQAEISKLAKQWVQIQGYTSQIVASILAIRGIDSDTLVFASSRDLIHEQRGEFIESCVQYIHNLLQALGLPVSALQTIRQLQDFRPPESLRP